MTRGFTSGCFAEVIVQAVGERVHQRLQPGRACGVLLLQLGGIDEELHAQILIDLGFAFGLGQAAHGVDVVGLDAIEIVFGLGVHHAEDGVGVGLAVDVRDAPVVADDGDVVRLTRPTRGFGTVRLSGKRNGRQQENAGARYFRYTMPPFMTNETLLSTLMSASGSPGTAITSAK